MDKKNKEKRKIIPRRDKCLKILIQKFGEVCWYCGISLLNRHRHIDHIKPVRLGGGNEIENLALACKFCNFAKWYSYLDEFYDWLNHVKSSDFKPKLKIDSDIHPTSSLYKETD